MRFDPEIMKVFILALSALIWAIVFYSGISHSEAKQTELTDALQPITITVVRKPIEPIQVTQPPVDHKQLECLAQNIYFESRSESKQGQLAVAHVTLNRVAHRKFPNSVCEVVKQARYSRWWKEHHGKNVPVKNKCQFSWYCDGKSDRINNKQAWQAITKLSLEVMLNQTQDPTAGAIYYYNPELADPYWKDSFEQVALVDNHVFLR